MDESNFKDLFVTLYYIWWIHLYDNMKTCLSMLILTAKILFYEAEDACRWLNLLGIKSYLRVTYKMTFAKGANVNAFEWHLLQKELELTPASLTVFLELCRPSPILMDLPIDEPKQLANLYCHKRTFKCKTFAKRYFLVSFNVNIYNYTGSQCLKRHEIKNINLSLFIR